MPPTLTMNDLVRVFGRTIFDRGLDYADEGAVFSLRQQGHILRGQVMGSHLYETRFELIPPYECQCTCPYDGDCKHAAALAITWLRREEAGEEIPRTSTTARDDSIRDRVGRLSDHNLLRLIMDLIDTVPGAHGATEEFLLKGELEGMGRVPGLAREEAEAVRSMLRSLLGGAQTHPNEADQNDDWEEEDYEDDDWEEESEEDWERHPGIENERDEQMLALDGQIDTLIGSVESHSHPESFPFCVMALVGCSIELVKAGERPGGIAARWSRQIARMVKKVAGLVVEQSCPDEVIVDALSEMLECYRQSASNLGTLLKPGLVEASANPAVREWLLNLLCEYSRTGSGPDLKRLYDLAGEVQASSGDLRAALASFNKAGASSETLLDLARQCQKSGDHEATVEACRIAVSGASSWNAADLRGRAATILAAVGDRAGARALLMENFRELPSLGGARMVLDTAQSPEERQTMATELSAIVGKSGDSALRVRLNLEAGRPRLALWVIQGIKEFVPELHVEVAAGLVEVDLDTAVELWTKAVQHFIGKKSRGAYAEAAKALVNMRRAMMQAEQPARWRAYYWHLQDRYQSYRALKDELEKAGL